jgi:hypothetical protein
MTYAQKSALKWLSDNGGDGSCQRGGVVLAHGEYGPHTAATWKRLADAGHVEFYRNGPYKRIRLTDLGQREAAQ